MFRPSRILGRVLCALDPDQMGTGAALESQIRSFFSDCELKVVQNAELIAVIANQQAAEAMRKAAYRGDADAAAQHLSSVKHFFSGVR